MGMGMVDEQEVIAVETAVGALHGRDCIYLDTVGLEGPCHTLTLTGEINGSLCSRPAPNQWLNYRVTFTGVLALRMIELDSWQGGVSSFDEIRRSRWVRQLGGKVTSEHRHFVIQTYDQVFDVVCGDYHFEVLGIRNA